MFPETGDAGDLDLQLLLKLINVYHWDRISERLAWGQKERGLVSALINIRNLYEGHVTPNRERELDIPRTVDILDGIYDFNKLINAAGADKIMKIIKKVEAPIVKQHDIKQGESRTKTLDSAVLQETDEPEPEQTVHEPETVKSELTQEAETPFVQTGEVHKEINMLQKKEIPVKTDAKQQRKSNRVNLQNDVQTDKELKYRHEAEKPQAVKGKAAKTSSKSNPAELEYTPIRKRQDYYDAELGGFQYSTPVTKKPSVKRSASTANKKRGSKERTEKKEPRYINVKRIGFITIFVLMTTIALVLIERFLSIAVEFFRNL